MSDLERIPDKKSKLTDFEENYNLTSKHLIHILGTNMALFICILLPIFLIGFIWTDFGVPEFGIRYISDGIVTVALFIIAEMMMMKVGTDGGKLDSDYLAAKNDFTSLVTKVHDVGTMFMAFFCEWQIDVELDQAVANRLRPLRLTRDDWERLKDMPYSEIKERYGKKRAKRIMEIKQLHPIDLNEAVLLYDNANGFTRGGVPMSGESYLKKKTHSVEMVLSCIFTGLLTVSVAMTFTSDISFARVMYTIFKLIILIYRMAVGYGLGAKAYNTVEARQLQAKSNYLRSYIRFVNDKTYLKLGNKYGDISCLIQEDNIQYST